MILSKGQFDSMLEAAKPLIKWLSENCHPHCSAEVDCGSVRLTEDIARNKTDEFIKDNIDGVKGTLRWR